MFFLSTGCLSVLQLLLDSETIETDIKNLNLPPPFFFILFCTKWQEVEFCLTVGAQGRDSCSSGAEMNGSHARAL